MPPPAVFDAGTLSGLTNPLAFIASPGRSPTPTSPSNPAANASLSATTNLALGTANLTFDFQPRTNSIFSAGQDVGTTTLSLAVADGDQNPVRVVPATVQIVGTGVGDGIMADIVGDFLGTGTPQTDSLADLGMTASLNFTNGYFEFDLTGPLLITSDIAPAYLSPPVPAPGFEFDKTDGLFDGIDPIASFLEASFVDNAGDLVPAVNADLAIAFDGSTIISDPVPEPASLALLGGGLLGLAWWRRRAARPIDRATAKRKLGAGLTPPVA